MVALFSLLPTQVTNALAYLFSDWLPREEDQVTNTDLEAQSSWFGDTGSKKSYFGQKSHKKSLDGGCCLVVGLDEATRQRFVETMRKITSLGYYSVNINDASSIEWDLEKRLVYSLTLPASTPEPSIQMIKDRYAGLFENVTMYGKDTPFEYWHFSGRISVMD